jgi:pyruvate,orthophosphate dikinase
MVYSFGAITEGDGSMKELLGGKGANLAEMTSIGLPVPPGFTITTETCAEYYNQGGKRLPHGLMNEVHKNMADAREGDWARSSATPRTRCSSRSARARGVDAGHDGHRPEPGLNDESVEGLAEADRQPSASRTTPTAG